MACALDGLTVLDLGSGPASALATMFLGDHGARVVRLVAPGTPHLREGGFIVWDRGKPCVTLDLGAALEGLEASARAAAARHARGRVRAPRCRRRRARRGLRTELAAAAPRGLAPI